MCADYILPHAQAQVKITRERQVIRFRATIPSFQPCQTRPPWSKQPTGPATLLLSYQFVSPFVQGEP